MCQNPSGGVYESNMEAVSAERGLRPAEVVNLARLSRLFRDQRIEALVCRSGINTMYLSGIATPGTLGRHLDLADTPRETFVVWPASGEPVVVVSEIASQLARVTSRIAHVHTYRDYVDTPEQALADVLGGMNVATSRVGFDQAWFGARRWAQLLRLIPEVRPVDCTDDLDRIRAVKTPAEIEHLKRSAALLDAAFAEVFPTVRPGLTERQVHARICAAALELGAGSVHGILQSSSNPVLYGGEGESRLEAGDLVRTDYVSYLGGYAANLSRLLHVGAPSPETNGRFDAYLAMYKEAVGLLRAGVSGGQIHRSIQDVFKSRGWESGPAISGHGIGLWFHQQPPLLVEGSTDMLEEGMVVAIEPISGHWHLQDEYLITDGAPQRLSDTFDLEKLPWTG
jgi:Xaa-Pro aminopeptidase